MNADERIVRIHFVDRLEAGTVPMMTFADPAPRYAVVARTSPDLLAPARSAADDDILDVIITYRAGHPPTNDARHGGAGVVIALRNAHVVWQPGRAALSCGADQSDAMLLALVDFSHYEGELRSLEGAIAAAWETLEEDKRLAFDVKPSDLRDQQSVGLRMTATLRRRIRHSRLSPHLYQPARHLPAASQQLSEELRAQANVEDRLEALDGHLEVFEHIYEMASQRMGEFRASHNEARLEWVIIVLLAAETLLLLFGTLWPHGM